MELGLFFLAFFVLLVLNCPIAFSMLLASFFFVSIKGLPLTIIVERSSGGLDSFPLVAIPLYIVAARIMNTGGITDRIFSMCLALVGHVRGGLAYVNVMASMIFAGVSGSAMADVAGLGVTEIKAMKDEGYDPGYVAAITAATCTIGPIIPPSVIFIIIGVLTETSIGRLFVGGFVPGLLLGLSIMVLVFFHARNPKHRFPPPRRRLAPREMRAAIRSGFLAFMAPVILLAAFFTGVVTPTEAGVVAVLYSLLVGWLYGELSWSGLYEALKDGAVASGVVMFIIATAQVFAWIVGTEQVAVSAFEFVKTITSQRWVILALVNIILLFMGCIIEGIAVILIAVPVLLPIMKAVGVDPVHFGVFLTLNVMIGLLTPPVGIAVYISSNQAGISVAEGFRKTAPFIVPLVVTLILITYVPGFVLWLPRLLFG
ncbi:MAG: TRAP transporter large permease [Zetaproteobacteria bacterium]|nr:MAG: TRAP transporter large permease [Zetaproteobacteria bacterium]